MAAGSAAQRARVTPMAMALAPSPTKAVVPSVHVVERTVQSFIHSERTSPLIENRPTGGTAA